MSLGDFDAISVNSLSYKYDGKSVLENISFLIKKGSYTALVGANGSGKSTLCRLICGLLDVQVGKIEKAEGMRVGLVFQSPKDQIVSSKVFRDTAFGPQNLGINAAEVEMRTIECLSVTDLLEKAEEPSNSLSLGQTQKLAMAGMLAVHPDILILDEALSMLDEEARSSIYDFLTEWHKKGNTIIHITHDIQAVQKAENVIGLDKGQLFYEGSSRAFLDNNVFVKRITGEALPENSRKNAGTHGECAFSFENLCFSYTDKVQKNEKEPAKAFINNLSFDLYKGSLTALTGPSGAGKSTLLELGAGLLKPAAGKVFCAQYPALAQQNCSAALFQAFAADDVAFGPKNEGLSGKTLLARVRSCMDMAGVPFAEYGERHSVELSGGEQRRLAIAGILAMDRDVLFFDEPTAGLDGNSRCNIMKMMKALAEQGKTVLFTTHHRDEASFADREIKIENGTIISDTAATVQDCTKPEPMNSYSSAQMLEGLKKASQSLSGSGWKTKCRLEKLPAAVRILVFLAMFTLSLIFRSIIPCSIMLVLSVIYCLLANFRFGRMLKTALTILPFLCFFAIFQIMFRPALPDEVCYTTWKYFMITPSKLWFCLNSILRTYAALFCVSAFFVSTPEYDLIDGLKKIIPSRNLILIMEIIFRFIPLLVDESAVIIKTQIIRGGLGKVKGKLARIRSVVPLIVPLIIRTVKRSEILADAIVMRCYDEK